MVDFTVDVGAAVDTWDGPRTGSAFASGLLGHNGYFHFGKPIKIEAGATKKGDKGLISMLFAVQDKDYVGKTVAHWMLYTGEVSTGKRSGTPWIFDIFDAIAVTTGKTTAEVKQAMKKKGVVTGETLVKILGKLDFYGVVGEDTDENGKIRSRIKYFVSKERYEDAELAGGLRDALSPQAQAQHSGTAVTPTNGTNGTNGGNGAVTVVEDDDIF